MNTGALITLVVALVAASGVAVGMAVAYARSEVSGAHLELVAGQNAGARDQVTAELERVRAGALDDMARRERLIADLKSRLQAAQERAIASNAPGAVRDDLRGLLDHLGEQAGARTLTASDLLPLRAAAEPAPTGAGGSSGTR